jgi:hypothetical protein
MLRFFRWRHLPSHLQAFSRPFALLALHIVRTTPRCAERSAGLRHLMEAKDCVVRAALPDTPFDEAELEDDAPANPASGD